jgi:Protein of unknown function (DUF3501)
MMHKLTRDDLWNLEAYADERPAFRHKVIAHKKLRQVALGPHATLYFEDRLTIKYQVQEMLRTERIFERAGIEDELAAYNPLIPDGTNWKATFMLEYPDAEERRIALGRLGGVEHKVWVQVDGAARIFTIANEDLERSRDEKTAAVHFLRFELDAASIGLLKRGASLRMGIDHPGLPYAVDVPSAVRDCLVQDLADSRPQ